MRSYRFEDNTTEELVFQIYHIDNIEKSNELDQQTFIGEAQFSLRELVANKFQEASDYLYNPEVDNLNLGKLKVKAIQSYNNYEDFKIKFGISDFVSKNPIVLSLSHKTDLDKFRPIYISDRITQKSKYSFFEECQIPVSECMKDKVTNHLLFQIFEIVKSEKYVLKCELSISASEIFGKVLNESRTRDEENNKKNKEEIHNNQINRENHIIIDNMNEQGNINSSINITNIMAKENKENKTNVNAHVKNKNKIDKEHDYIEFLMVTKNNRYRNYLLLKKVEVVKVFKFYDYLVSSLELKTFMFLDLTRSKINVDYLELFNNLNDEIEQNQELPSYMQVSNIRKSKIIRVDSEISESSEDENEEVEFNDILEEENKDKESSIGSFTKAIGRKKKIIKTKKKLEEDINDNKNIIISEKLDLVNPKEEFQTCLDILIKNLIRIDSSRGFPLFGFGAKLPPLYDSVNNCFALSMDILKPEVDGYLGFFDAYTKILSKVDLYGPANLSESLETLVKFLTHEKFNHNEQFYAVGVFIVTSRITDLIHSIKLIIKSSHYPCSVLIIGAGYEFQLENEKGFEEFEWINNLTSETTYKEIKENYDMNIKERPLRKNSVFVDFYSLFDEYGQGLRKEAAYKPVLKKIFNEICSSFLDYVRQKDIPPIDYLELNKKTHAHFLEFKKDKLNEDFNIPEFLTIEKNLLVNKLKDIGISQYEIEEYIPILPSFELHYLISTLNYHKHFKKRKVKENPFEKYRKKEKKYLYVNGNVMIDERDDLKKIINNDFFEELLNKK